MLQATDCKDVVLGKNTFHIFPFSAFKAARLSGDLVKLLAPFLKSRDIQQIDVDEISSKVSSFADALESLDGDKVERMMRALMMGGNISVTIDGDTEWLSESLVDKCFMGDIFNMYKLCLEVIKFNFSSFFEVVKARIGTAQG